MACNNCGCGCGNNSNNGGCGCNRPVQKGCTCLAKDVYTLIEKLEDTLEDLEAAWDALEDAGCLKETTNSGNCGCGNCGCGNCGCG
ncbi:MAG: hypothetical protein RR090_06815, partial [Niameybacter sp.]